MATRITQVNYDDDGSTMLRVEGEMYLEDALLLEKIAAEIHADLGSRIVFDLAELDLLDSESAAVLRRLSNTSGYEIIGMEIFVQSAVNEAEGRSR